MSDIVTVAGPDGKTFEVDLNNEKNYVMKKEDAKKLGFTEIELNLNREIHYNCNNFSTIVFHKDGQEWRFPLNEFFDKLMKWMKEN